MGIMATNSDSLSQVLCINSFWGTDADQYSYYDIENGVSSLLVGLK